MRAARLLIIVAAVATLPQAVLAQQESRSRTVVIARPGWLGINYGMSITRENGRETETLTINDVVPNSPAAKAGLKKGERIVRIDGEPVTSRNFERVARGMKEGDALKLRVASGSSERDVTVVAEERPAQYFSYSYGPGTSIVISGDSIQKRARIFLDSARINAGEFFRMPMMRDSLFLERFKSLEPLHFDTTFPGGRFRIMIDSLLTGDNFIFERFGPAEGIFPRIEMRGMNAVAGAEFEPINEGLGHYFGTDRGLLVLRVLPQTPAASAGLEAGDVVIRAGGREISDISALRSALARTGSNVQIELLRRGKNVKLEMRGGTQRR